MWGHMGIEMGFQVAQAGMSFIAGMQEAKAKKAWQRYNNAMTRIADGQNQNTITTNQNMAIERSTVQSFEIEKSEYATRAAAEAAAAATDTAGRSVNQTLFAIERNGAVAQHNRMQDLEYEMLGFDNQRRMSAFQTAQQIDHTTIPSPDLVSTLLGLGAGLHKTYMRYSE